VPQGVSAPRLPARTDQVKSNRGNNENAGSTTATCSTSSSSSGSQHCTRGFRNGDAISLSDANCHVGVHIHQQLGSQTQSLKPSVSSTPRPTTDEMEDTAFSYEESRPGAYEQQTL